MGLLIEGVFKMSENYVTDIKVVADFFLSKGEMTQKKLQKMCYYAYSWYLALYDEFLFNNGKFEAWVHGPVNPELYQKYKHCGWKKISKSNAPKLQEDLREFLDMIFDTFNSYNADELESMTHQEQPWIEARQGYQPEEPSHVTIKDCTIKNFYRKLMEDAQVE